MPTSGAVVNLLQDCIASCQYVVWSVSMWLQRLSNLLALMTKMATNYWVRFLDVATCFKSYQIIFVKTTLYIFFLNVTYAKNMAIKPGKCTIVLVVRRQNILSTWTANDKICGSNSIKLSIKTIFFFSKTQVGLRITNSKICQSRSKTPA